MASDREPMTAGGYQALKEELKRLKSVERIEIAKQIEVARAHGDLSENAEYHAAREKQSFIEGRIKELESKLALAEIIDPKTLSGNKVVFGATVKLLDCESEDEIKYQIVGDDEADLKQGKISVKAPLARALIGQRVGEIVTIKNPKKGDREYEILSVDFI
jgi:transcription elongation factor GreA